MIEVRRNSRGEWCAAVPLERGGYASVHGLRTLVPLAVPDSATADEALAAAEVRCRRSPACRHGRGLLWAPR